MSNKSNYIVPQVSTRSQAVLGMYQRGGSVTEISKRMGVSRQCISQTLKNLIGKGKLLGLRSSKHFKQSAPTESEIVVFNKLRDLGFHPEIQPYNAPYDILVNEFKLEVKHRNTSDGDTFLFGNLVNRERVDFYILVCWNLHPQEFFIIPFDKLNKSVTLKISDKKYEYYRNNWSLLLPRLGG